MVASRSSLLVSAGRWRAGVFILTLEKEIGWTRRSVLRASIRLLLYGLMAPLPPR